MIARALAKDLGHKEAVKDCRKGEKMFGKTGKNNEPWRLLLYDSVCTKKDELTDMFVKSDSESPGKVTKEDFLDILQNVGIAVPSQELMKSVVQLYLVENLISYQDFIAGKKYVNKQYLMSAFEGKKKKKKKKVIIFILRWNFLKNVNKICDLKKIETQNLYYINLAGI